MSALLSGEVWKYLFASRAEKDVVFALADHGHDDGTHIFPGILYLAWKCELSEREVQRILRDLQDRGIIKPIKNEIGGRGKATEYELHLTNATPKPTFRRGDPTCLEGVKYHGKKGDKSTSCDSERVTNHTVKGDKFALKGDKFQGKGDKSPQKWGDQPRQHHDSSLLTIRTIEPIEPSSMPSASPQDGMQEDFSFWEGEWELPAHSPNLVPTPLFPSEENQPATAVTPERAPRTKATTGERVPRPHNALWDALEATIGHPPTPAMRKAWGVACSQLKEMLATPEQVAERADVYRKRWPTMPLTVNALAKHWLDLDPQANISLMPPQRVATFAPVAEPRRKTPRYFEDVYGSGAAR